MFCRFGVMKELDISKLVPEKTKLEITQQKQQEYKMTYQYSIIPHSSHTLYEIDLESGDIIEAEYERRDYIFDWNWTPKSRVNSHGDVIIQPGKAYVSALNKKNAEKKFKKGSTGTRIDKSKIYLEL